MRCYTVNKCPNVNLHTKIFFQEVLCWSMYIPIMYSNELIMFLLFFLVQINLILTHNNKVVISKGNNHPYSYFYSVN